MLIRHVCEPLLFTNAISTNLAQKNATTVLSAKSDSDIMFCLQSYQGLLIDRLLVY